MTTRDLTVRRDHLANHRRMIIGRSVVAAIVGAIPVPLLDTRLSYLVQRSTVRKLAQASQVDIDESAAERIIYGQSEPPNLAKILGGTAAFRILIQSWRKAVIAYLAARRAQVAGRYFLTATLFDHYCTKLHLGLGLDGPAAAELRTAMDQALAQTPGALGSQMFRRALVAAVRATARAPLELADIASRGALRRLLTARSSQDQIEAAEEIDTQIQRQLDSQTSFLARVTTAVELQLSVEQNPYLDELMGTFERIWRERDEAGQ